MKCLNLGMSDERIVIAQKNNPVLGVKAGERIGLPPMAIRCGHCYHCRIVKRNEWVVRNHFESLTTVPRLYLTFTYAQNAIPRDLAVRRDHYKTIKEKIKEYFGDDIRTYGIGHHMPVSGTPHFHMLIYCNRELEVPGETFYRKIRGRDVYYSYSLGTCWEHGYIAYNHCDGNVGAIAAYGSVDKEKLEERNNLRKIAYQAALQKQQDLGVPPRAARSNAKKEAEGQDAIFFSCQGLGWQGFMENFETYFEQRSVYINGHQFFVSREWLRKLSSTRYHKEGVTLQKERLAHAQQVDVYDDTLLRETIIAHNKSQKQRQRELREEEEDEDIAYEEIGIHHQTS